MMDAPSASALVDDAEASFDARAFRQCLGEFATGVTVITAKVGAECVGVTANSFSSLSLEPPLVLWSISRQSRSFAAFEAASHFAINVLAVDQIDIARRFSSLSDDKFAKVAWSPGRSGAPVLDGVVAVLECRRHAAYDGGDHLILVGHVERFARFDGDALLFVQGRYGIIEDHPDTKTGADTAPEASRSSYQESPLMTLLLRAYHYMSVHFEEHRKAVGVTLAQVRVLVGLYDTAAGLTFDALMRRMYLGQRDAEDAIAELIARAYVIRDASGRLNLTEEGRRCREAISARVAAFEAEQLADIPPAEVEQGRRFLGALVDKQQRMAGQ